jgi:methionyl-tRNA formyltransferase
MDRRVQGRAATPGLRLACFGLPLAPYLLLRDGHDVRLSVLSPIDAPGRRRVLHALGPDRVLDARALGGKLDAAIERALVAEAPDLIVSWFWTRRLSAKQLGHARLGGLGVHPSLLPRHRGPNPYFWAIDAGDAETGVTVHRLTPRYDDGDVLARSTVAVGERNAWQLARALDRPSLALLRQVVQSVADGSPPPAVPQREADATWAPEPEGDALHLDFGWPTERVLRRLRALSPVPGALLDVEGMKLVVTAAEPATDFPGALEPGEAATAGEPPRVVIRTGTGAIALTRGQRDDEEAALEPLDASDLGRLVAAHLGREHATPAGQK